MTTTAVRHVATKAFLFILLATCFAVTACASKSDYLVVQRGPEGAVILERLPARGTTIRYSGPLKSFRASHPVSFSPDILAKALGGIHVGIAPSEGDQSPTGVKPTPLFSPGEVAFLAPAVAAALEQAESDQRVKVEVGPGSDRSGGTLYVEGRTIRLALSHFHSSAQRRDVNLSIYILSMKPEQAQDHTAAPRSMLEIEPDQPRLAIQYDALESLLPPAPGPSGQSPSAEQPSQEGGSLKEVVDKQAQELESLKAELEALKKQMPRQPRSSPAKPAP